MNLANKNKLFIHDESLPWEVLSEKIVLNLFKKKYKK